MNVSFRREAKAGSVKHYLSKKNNDRIWRKWFFCFSSLNRINFQQAKTLEKRRNLKIKRRLEGHGTGRFPQVQETE